MERHRHDLDAPAVYRTASVPPARRALYWSELYQRHVSPIAFEPADAATFDAELSLAAIGPLRIVSVRFDKSSIVRRPEHVARVTRRILSFVVVLRGAGVLRHHGRESRFDAGDTVLVDNTSPSHCSYDASADVVVVRAPEDILRRRLPAIDEACGSRLARGVGLADTACCMAKTLARSSLVGGLPPRYGPEVAAQLVDVLATAYTIALGGEVPETTLHSASAIAARNFIEGRLDDPHLTPRAVAQALEMSPRRLREAMAAAGESLTAYVLRRRLEEAAKTLVAAAWRDRTITDIAFAWGFNSSGYFTRVFKDKYGVAPSEYRARHTARASD